MPYILSRRQFLQASAACAAAAVAGAEGRGAQPPSPGKLVLNDDGYVFLNLNDDLGKADLRRYLQSYCRPGVDLVAYCVGDMSWPTLYPSRVGVPYSVLGAGDDFRRARIYRTSTISLPSPAATSARCLGSFASWARNSGQFPHHAPISRRWTIPT